MQTSKDYYLILGVEPSSSPAEIKAAYRTLGKDKYNIANLTYFLAKRYHPDVNAMEDGYEPNAQKFMEVAEAYAVLSVYESKLDYDLRRRKKIPSKFTEDVKYISYIYIM